MMRKTEQPLIFLVGVLVGVFIISAVSFGENENLKKKEGSEPVKYQWHAPELPMEMDFAGERVPVEKIEVREQLDRQYIYNFYNQGNILYIIKLSKRYFPLIEERLKMHGVPDDFKYLCVAESSLQNAVSKMGAVGFWQFMSYTAPGYDLEMSKEVDERYNVIKSTDAACKYLKQAYAKYGNWTAAAASYNCGQGGYSTQAAFQETTNYYDLYLPEETNNYIFRILTFKYILSNAEALGFKLSGEDLYKEASTRTIIVKNSIHNLAQWAIDNGTTYKMLRIINPWLRSRSLIVKPGKSYEIKIPEQ